MTHWWLPSVTTAFTIKKLGHTHFGICSMECKVAKLSKMNVPIFVLVTLVLVSLLLLVSGKRVLVWETKVNPGDNYVLAEWGELGKGEQAQLVCRYFTGRSIQPIVYWYSPNGLLGIDQCPFISDGGS